MAVFNPESRLTHELDYRLAASGPVSMFFSTEVLRSNVAWLSDHGYRVVHLEASGWRTEQDMHADLALALNFPDYYGRNLDALNECLSDVAGCDYGFSEADAGLVLVMRGIDRFMQRQPRLALDLMDAVVGAVRGAALFGHRILCLVQSDDPNLEIPPIGAALVSWNDAEWLNSNRHP